jgi:hypothetical protein
VFNQPTATRMANAYNAGARISSNSWGYTTGNNYNADTQSHDASVRDAVSGTAGNQELAIVFAAGNSGPGASTIHPPGTGKNVLTVAASENFRMTGTDGCGIGNTGADNALDIISFSGRGPTSDSRKKPEITAPGTHIEGAASRATGYDGSGVCNQFWPTGQTLYAWSSGTSHSTPAVSGLLRADPPVLPQQRLTRAEPGDAQGRGRRGATYMNGVGANDTLLVEQPGLRPHEHGAHFDGAGAHPRRPDETLGTTGDTYTRSGNVVTPAALPRGARLDRRARADDRQRLREQPRPRGDRQRHALPRQRVQRRELDQRAARPTPRNNTECVFLPAGTSGSFSVDRARHERRRRRRARATATRPTRTSRCSSTTAARARRRPDFSLGATPVQSRSRPATDELHGLEHAPQRLRGNVTCRHARRSRRELLASRPNPDGARRLVHALGDTTPGRRTARTR